MTRFCTFGLLFVGLARGAAAQVVRAPILSPFAKDYRVDFAVPDAPAFKLLDVNESAILRPQSVREIGVAASGFNRNGNLVGIPRQLAAEVSPGLLIGGGQLKLTSYNARKLLYATRLSAATGRDAFDHGQLAAGVRISLVDEQDMRRLGAAGDDSVITRFTDAILAQYVAARQRVGPRAALTLNDDEQAAVKQFSDSIRQRWADNYWNANSIEVAFAGRATGSDSLGHDLRVDQLASWITIAHGLKGWGQLLLGAKLGAVRDSLGAYRAANSAAIRLYIGSNGLKAFTEGQFAFSNAAAADPDWLVNAGVEFRLPIIGWINASAGYAPAFDGRRARLLSSFKLKSALPGL